MATPTTPSTERSVGELLESIAKDTSLLVRQEVQLATTEMTLKAQAFGRNAAFIGVGAGLALLGLVGLMFAAIFALEAVLPLWAAALVVACLIAVPGVMLMLTGIRSLRQLEPLPNRTIKTLKQDLKWLKGAFQ